MTQGFFLNPTLIKEILLWHSNTRENLVVFEPIARACKITGNLLASHDEKMVDAVGKTLEAWCASADFFQMISEAAKSNSSISISLARESLAQISRSDSFVAGLPVDDVLSAFSALVRADLRARESRSSAHLDELFLFQSAFKPFGLHDITLLLAASCASKNVLQVFDRLLQIKEDPTTLLQVDTDSLSAKISAQFASGLRMFALSNLEAAEQAFTLAIEKDKDSPSPYIALSLLHLLNSKSDQVNEFIHLACSRTDSTLPQGIKQLSQMLLTKEDVTISADDPVSIAVLLFFLNKTGQFEQVTQIAEKHIEKYPSDLIVQNLWAESIISPIRNELINDPPLPGLPNPEHAKKLSKAKDLLIIARQEADSRGLSAMKCLADSNLSCLSLMNRDFVTAEECASEALSIAETNSAAKINYATAMLAVGDLPKLIGVLEGISPEYKRNALRLKAEAFYHTCSFAQAIELWNEIESRETDRLWQLRLLCRKLESFRLLRDEKNAQLCVDKLLSAYKNEPETLFAIAYELWQLNRTDDAVHALKIAKDLAAPNLQKWIAWELGRILFDIGQVLSATDEYVSIADPDTDSTQAREFAVALYKAGLLPAACQRAKSIRLAHGEVVPGITEIETDVLVREGKLAEAKELLIQLAIVRPLSVLNRLAIIRLCLSLKQEDEAREHLKNLRELELSAEMQEEVNKFAEEFHIVS